MFLSLFFHYQITSLVTTSVLTFQITNNLELCIAYEVLLLEPNSISVMCERSLIELNELLYLV